MTLLFRNCLLGLFFGSAITNMYYCIHPCLHTYTEINTIAIQVKLEIWINCLSTSAFEILTSFFCVCLLLKLLLFYIAIYSYITSAKTQKGLTKIKLKSSISIKNERIASKFI